MSDLEKARKDIESIDKEMAVLFQKRMNCVKEVADFKIKNGMPILDSNRETALLKKNEANISEEELIPYYRTYLKDVMAVSKEFQNALMEGLRVAYSGIEGAFANIAANKIFPGAVKKPYGSFRDAYEAVVRGEADVCVLPIENSYAGEVGQVTDLLFEGNLTVSGIYDLPVNQNLLAVKGAKLCDIKKVISHPQALEQCGQYIFDHNLKQETRVNTAVAAKEVADSGDNSVAAIASLETAELYDLQVLEKNINKSAQNTTRFAVLSNGRDKKPVSGDYSTFILMFTLKNTSGSLAKALSTIGEYGYNIRAIRSRPLRDKTWEYYFYLEIEGKISSTNGQEMLKALDSKCDRIKVLGKYTPGALL